MRQDGEMTRKGPWTEHEDVQLVFHVNIFGDRRWDFIAKVSGLKRSGKSCRLRWVNYLDPGLKRGKMAPHEERLVLELHSKLGNRWSKIARKLPGRTDNEIKNYWRTHMRKKAQEKKRSTSQSTSPSLSNCSSSSSICTSNTVESTPVTQTKERSFYDTGGIEMVVVTKGKTNGNSNCNNNIKKNTTSFNHISDKQEGYYSMDEVWKDIELLEDDSIKPFFDPYSEIAPSLMWDSSLNFLGTMDGQEEIGENKFFFGSERFKQD